MEQNLPTDEDINLYEKMGWHITNMIIEPDLIEKAVIGAREFYVGNIDTPLPKSFGIANDLHDEALAIRNNEFVSLQKKALKDIAFHPVVVETAARLSRSKNIRLFADSLISKLPQKENSAGIIGWHTDKAYWPTCTSDDMLTAWIPLQDVTFDMGPLLLINESHTWKEEAWLKKFYSFNKQDLSELEKNLKENFPDYTEQTITIKKGQVSFHNCNVVHCSRPNLSSVNRMALAVHFQDERNRYRKAFKDNGDLIEIGYDKICRKDENGHPDYNDPYFFPVVYPLNN